MCEQYYGEMHVHIVVIRYFSFRNGEVYNGEVLCERMHFFSHMFMHKLTDI